MKKLLLSVPLVLFLPSLALASTCPALSYGSTGANVTVLQQFLYSQYQNFPQPTGYFGTLTQEAVQQWQRTNNVVSSGTPATTGYGAVGPRTSVAMKLSCVASGSATATMTSTQSSGTASLVQALLAELKVLEAEIAALTSSTTVAATTTTIGSVTGGGGGGGGITIPPVPLASCTFNDQSILSGASVTAYQSSTVPSGQLCALQTRTCTNGVLSGTYTNTSCSVTTTNATSTNSDTQRKQDLQTLANALNAYYQKHNTYLVASAGAGGTGDGVVSQDGPPTSKTIVQGLYADSDLASSASLPTSPSSANDFYMLYVCNAGQSFALSAKLDTPAASDITNIQNSCNGTGANGTYSVYGRNYAVTSTNSITYTPEMFGATHDGVHNDAPAINAAIAALSTAGGGTLQLACNATYNLASPGPSYGGNGLSEIVPKPGVSINGCGASTVLHIASNINQPTATFTGTTCGVDCLHATNVQGTINSGNGNGAIGFIHGAGITPATQIVEQLGADPGFSSGGKDGIYRLSANATTSGPVTYMGLFGSMVAAIYSKIDTISNVTYSNFEIDMNGQSNDCGGTCWTWTAALGLEHGGNDTVSSVRVINDPGSNDFVFQGITGLTLKNNAFDYSGEYINPVADDYSSIYVDATNVTITNNVFDNGPMLPLGGGAAIEMHGTNVVASGNTISDYMNGANLGDTTSSHLVFQNNTLNNVNDGVTVWGSPGATENDFEVLNNSITMSSSIANYAVDSLGNNTGGNNSNLQITGNTISVPMGSSVSCWINYGGFSPVTVSGNVFSGASGSGVCKNGTAVSQPAS